MNKLIVTAVLLAFSLPACTGATDGVTPGANNFSGEIVTSTTIPGIAEKNGLGVCAGFYTNNFEPVVGAVATTPDPSTQATEPDRGARFADPAYKTCVVRASDYVEDGVVGRSVPIYSRSQAFNADSSKFITFASDGWWHLYNTDDLSYIRRVTPVGGNMEVNWHPTDPDIFYRIDGDGGMHIYEHNIFTSTETVVADFNNVKSILGNTSQNDIEDIWPGVARFSTDNEGSMSADGRYWALMGMSNDFNTQFGIIVYDMIADAIIGVYDYSNAYSGNGVIARPNNISMSPSGKYVVALWNPPGCDGEKTDLGAPEATRRPTVTELGSFNKPCGAMAFNRELTEAKGIGFLGEHGDTALDVNGKDVYIGSDHSNTGSMRIVDLETGNLVATPVTNICCGAMHYSGRAFNRPGWVIVSTYGDGFVDSTLVSKVFAVSLSETPQIINLAHHYSTAIDESNPDPDSNSGYFSQPHATVNRQGTKVLFGSDWGDRATDSADTYIIMLPENLDGL